MNRFVSDCFGVMDSIFVNNEISADVTVSTLISSITDDYRKASRFQTPKDRFKGRVQESRFKDRVCIGLALEFEVGADARR